MAGGLGKFFEDFELGALANPAVEIAILLRRLNQFSAASIQLRRLALLLPVRASDRLKPGSRMKRTIPSGTHLLEASSLSEAM